MGKSEGNAVWINEEKLPSYDYYQYFRNIGDAEVGKCLRIYTDLPIDEIRRLESLKDKEINEAKKILAFEATKICRGETEATQRRTRPSKPLKWASPAETCQVCKKRLSTGSAFWTPFWKSVLLPVRAKRAA